MPDEIKIQKAADQLWQAQSDLTPCNPVRTLIGEQDVETAYAVQAINTKRFLKQGRQIIGRKIGLTAKTVQQQLGVNQPDYGMLFADMDVPDGEEIAIGRVLQPKVEAEIAFVLDQDLDSEQLTITDVIGAIRYAMAAIEIVGSRIANWDIRITDTIADNASSGLFVVGQEPRKVGEFDPRLCGMAMERSGDVVSVGAGAACLGSPINTILWLAKTMAAVGQPLKSGELILSGALGPMFPARPGDIFEARISGVGSVRAAFAAEE